MSVSVENWWGGKRSAAVDNSGGFSFPTNARNFFLKLAINVKDSLGHWEKSEEIHDSAKSLEKEKK